jgi:hypothetical protein
MREWEIIADNLKKLVGAGLWSHRLILRNERKPIDLEKGTPTYRNGNSSVTFFSPPLEAFWLCFCKRLRNISLLNRSPQAAFQL